jgi:2,4-dienoyl-CoA reductase-like NADH-dependent reductase (Old Yellow Enzyme family)
MRIDEANRIVSTGHETAMAGEGGISEPMVAYHRARAAGGAGLIIIEVALVHASAVFVRHPIPAYSDDCIPGYRRVAEAVQAEGCAIFGQLFLRWSHLFGQLGGFAKVYSSVQSCRQFSF